MTGQMRREAAAPLSGHSPAVPTGLIASHCSQQPSKGSFLETHLWATGFWKR